MKQTKTLLTIIAVMFCIPAAVSAQELFTVGGIVYSITPGQTVEVQPYYNLLNNPYSGAVSIPQTVEYDGTVYTVTALGEMAFESCTGVTSLTLPATIRNIGSYCFYNCNFTSLQLPDSLRTLGDHAFLYSRVGSLHLPACFEEYSEGSFWGRNLTSITVDDANPHYRSMDGWLYSRDSTTLCIVPDGVWWTINVPPFVRHIGKQAFGFNSNSTSITLPEGLISIGDFAFNICQSVNNIVIPSTVTYIGKCPFSYCPDLTNLSIAEGNTHYVMDGLMIYSSDFDTLVSCHKSGATVTLNPNLKVLGGFENNTWVRNIDIPAGVTDILDNCFNGCAFTSIEMPTHLKSIGSLAFATNRSLRSVRIQQVDTLNVAVFSQTNLDHIRFTVGIPPVVKGLGPLYDVVSLDSIVVPCGSLNAWLSDSYWGQFADLYVEDCNIGFDDPNANIINIYTHGGRIIVDGANDETGRIFDITGRCVRNEALPTGVYIVKVGNRPARKIVVVKQ
ncbi:MAG: leucine-rich repeat domain-containing protein [Bacteroidales bacterium]|nr:leucine-rich repeat domain-containing protein [Bacteroidales bacterium]